MNEYDYLRLKPRRIARNITLLKKFLCIYVYDIPFREASYIHMNVDILYPYFDANEIQRKKKTLCLCYSENLFKTSPQRRKMISSSQTAENGETI